MLTWHTILKDIAQLLIALTGLVAGVVALLKAVSNSSKIASLTTEHGRNADDIRQLNSDQTKLALATPPASPPLATEATLEGVKEAVQAKKSKP